MSTENKPEAVEQEPVAEVIGQFRNAIYQVRTLCNDLPAGTNLYTHAPDSAARIAELEKRLEWQPIETAPKERKYQDGNNLYGEFILAWYPGAMAPMRVRWWWRDDCDSCNFITDGRYSIPATHWMPLPNPPAIAKATGEQK